nr:hypothetical protein [Tanacetum cinerariifolium]
DLTISGIRAKGITQHNNSCFNHQESAMHAEFEDERKKKRKEAADSEQKEKKEEVVKLLLLEQLKKVF